MNSGLRVVLISVLTLLSSAQVWAFADGPKEFFLNSAGFEMFGGADRISIAPGFNFGFLPWLQAGGSVSYQKVGFGEDSVNTFTVLAGPTFNVDPASYTTSTFIFLGYAMRSGSGEVADPTADPGGSGITFMVGRRIPLFDGIGYRPSVGLQLAGRATLVINVLAISYIF
jgi:hypothetical protein